VWEGGLILRLAVVVPSFRCFEGGLKKVANGYKKTKSEFEMVSDKKHLHSCPVG
jgi:hypothetical protein